MTSDIGRKGLAIGTKARRCMGKRWIDLSFLAVSVIWSQQISIKVIVEFVLGCRFSSKGKFFSFAESTLSDVVLI